MDSQTMGDRPASEEGFVDASQEHSGGMGKVLDLSVEANHVPYLNRLLLARVLPPLDSHAERLESVMWHQPNGTMHKIVAAFSELDEEFDKRRTVLLKSFESRYVP